MSDFFCVGSNIFFDSLDNKSTMNISEISSIAAKNQLTPLNSEIVYKGHGKIESASEGSSILHVISHELDHVAEFKAQAHRDEVEIRNIDMEIHFEFRNGRLVAVGGNTKMTSVHKSPQMEEVGAQLNLFPNSLFIPSKEEIELQEETLIESQFKEKIEMIQGELRSVLNKAILKEMSFDEEKTKDVSKQMSYRQIRNRLQNEIEELKNRVEAEKSKEILLHIKNSQNLGTGFIDPEEINVLISANKHLDLLS